MKVSFHYINIDLLHRYLEADAEFIIKSKKEVRLKIEIPKFEFQFSVGLRYRIKQGKEKKTISD